MRHRAVAIIALVLTGALCGPSPVNAQSMADYTASPVFIDDATTPNILLMMDNSLSTYDAAYSGVTFDTTKTYDGLFEATECYSYSGKFIPNPAADPAAPGLCTTASYYWSGNLVAVSWTVLVPCRKLETGLGDSNQIEAQVKDRN